MLVTLAGQVFDYLMLLKSFYGLSFNLGSFLHMNSGCFSGCMKLILQPVSNLQSISNSGQSPFVVHLPEIPCFDKRNKNFLIELYSGPPMHRNPTKNKKSLPVIMMCFVLLIRKASLKSLTLIF